MAYFSNYVTDFGFNMPQIDTVIQFTEGSLIGTRDDLIAILGLTYWNLITVTPFSCPYCFGKLRKVLITTNDKYQVEAEIPFTFSSNEWINMLADLNANPRIIGVETFGERINNHYLGIWL